MFGLSWGEFLVVGVVALIVIGPKDLPGLFRTMGEFTGKARRMAREFSRAMEQAADESGVNDINKTLRAASNPVKFGTDAIRDSVSSSLKSDDSTLSEERKADKEKINASMEKAATERMERERAAEAAAAAEARKPVSTKTPEKKATAKTAPAKKPAAKKTAAKPKAKPKAKE